VADRERDKTLHDPVRTRLGVGEGARAAEEDLKDTVVLERYVIESKLGAGAMGTVWRGSDLKTRRGVAIKIMHVHLGREPTMLARFHREARAAARLRHENLAGVLDVGVHGRSPAMVLELATGPSLREVMDDALSPARIASLVGGILHGLDHAHKAGIIHRDLKPENVIVENRQDGGDRPRIVDFGIAAFADPEDTFANVKLTGTGVVIGTPMYMAPEQALGEPLDHRVDLFALGVAMYEMLAGKPPFDGTVHQIVMKNIRHDPAPIEQADPLLDRFARKLMARELPKRFASAHAALDVLALLEEDRGEAGLALGVIDVAKALSVIGLPEPPEPSEPG
jgi:serine/threonine-protein kinase